MYAAKEFCTVTLLLLFVVVSAGCSGGGGTSVTTGGGGGVPVISTFTATPSTITSGLSSTLAWSVTGATSLSINQGVGTVTGTNRSVNPTVTTIYTLTATNSAGSTTRSTTVNVNPAGTGTATPTWVASVVDATHGAPDVYYIYSCVSASPCNNYNPTPIASVGSTATSYTETGLASGYYYCYDVKAYNTGGYSPSACGSGNYCCKQMQ